MNIQTILKINAGHVVPDEYLQLLLDKKPNTFGFAVQNIEDGKPDLSVTREEGTPTLAELKEFMRNRVDFNALVCFGYLTGKVNSDDILPLVLTDNDDKPFMAIGLEGDFPKFADPASSHTDEYNLASKILIPTLLEICEYADGDLEKIIAKLNAPLFNDTFLSHIGHRGIMNIMPLEGDIITLGKNDIGESYDWGSTSNRYTYGDAVQEPVKAEEPKKKFSFGSKKAAITTDDKGIHTVAKDTATKGADGPRTSVPEVSGKEKKDVVFRLPSWVHKNEDVKDLYMMVCGKVPDLWKKRIPVTITIPEEQLPKNLDELRIWKAEQLKNKMAASNKTETAAIAPKNEKPTKETEAILDKAADNLPIIEAKDMEKVLDFVAKHLDGQSNVMPNPLELQAIEKKFPAFSESLGITPHEMLNWPLSGLFALAKTDSRAIVLAFVEMRNLWRSTLTAADLVGTSKVKTTVTKVGDNTVKTESVSTEQAPAAKKTNKFGFGKKVAA